jgi:exodeoxyribonuclease VIII
MIEQGLAFENYLARDAVSKTQLWTLHTRSPAHARVEKEQSNAMAMGVAVHCAVLEPDCFRERFVRGPDDRRGNKWKEAIEEHGARLLTAGDYDDALAIRDALMHEPVIRQITGAAETLREASAFASCPETGLAVRCRPDAWQMQLGLMADLKTTTDARPEQFARRVEQFGYHAQEAHYTDTWTAAGGGDISAFVFIAVETKPPYAYALYELEPSAVVEGRLRLQQAKATWAECARTGVWPGYAREIQPLDLRKWAYRLTTPEENL